MKLRTLIFLIAFSLAGCRDDGVNPTYPAYFKFTKNFDMIPLDIVTDAVGNFYVNSFDSDSTSLILKLDNNLKVVWSKLFVNSKIKSFIITSDNRLLCTGKAISNSAFDDDAWTVMLDSEGIIAWESFNGSEYKDQGNSIVETVDGNYIICGKTHQNSRSIERGDVYIFELSASGNTLRERSFISIWNQEALSIGVIDSASGRYAIATHSLRADTILESSYDIWLVNNGFEIESVINLTGVADTNGGDIRLITDDTGSILTWRYVAESKGEGLICHLEKIENTGHTSWSHAFDNLLFAQDMIVDYSGNYHVVTRGTKSNPIRTEMRLMKFTNTGEEFWDEPYASHISASPTCILQVNSNKFLIGGSIKLDLNMFRGFYMFVNSEGSPIK